MGNQMYLSAKAAFMRIDALLNGEDRDPVRIIIIFMKVEILGDAISDISFQAVNANLSWESFDATN